jgi:hypothetical protein
LKKQADALENDSLLGPAVNYGSRRYAILQATFQSKKRKIE